MNVKHKFYYKASGNEFRVLVVLICSSFYTELPWLTFAEANSPELSHNFGYDWQTKTEFGRSSKYTVYLELLPNYAHWQTRRGCRLFLKNFQRAKLLSILETHYSPKLKIIFSILLYQMLNYCMVFFLTLIKIILQSWLSIWVFD